MPTDDALIKRRFGKNLRRLREVNGLSQEGLADLCESDRTYIGGIERGERNPSLVNIYKIARALNIKPSELFISLDAEGASDA